MTQIINLTKEEKEQMISRIQAYYQRERGEQIGELKAMMILDFFNEELAPTFYNRGIRDAHAYMTVKIDDLFEIEKYVE